MAPYSSYLVTVDNKGTPIMPKRERISALVYMYGMPPIIHKVKKCPKKGYALPLYE